MQLYGIKFLGLNAHNGEKLLFSLCLIAAIVLLRIILHALARLLVRGLRFERARFWTHQGINIATTVVFFLGLLSIWFSDPSRLATIAGLIGAGVAFALQKLITAIAGYLVILRGKTFSIGDRVVIGRCAATSSRWTSFKPPYSRWGSRRTSTARQIPQYG
jgi:small-conductance mechanosensitive channel